MQLYCYIYRVSFFYLKTSKILYFAKFQFQIGTLDFLLQIWISY